MDFKLTEEQEFFRKTITDTIDKIVVPKSQEIDEKDEFPWETWKEFTSLGYLGLRYPEEIGGMNADKIMSMIFYEEIARGSVGFAQSVIMNILMGTYFIYRFGNDAIKERCLLPAMRGEKIATMCFTEDQSGSDLGATRTTAVKDGDGWRINGTKMWITNGPICNFCTVLATTDPSKGLKGLNFFLVEKGTPGFSSGQIIHKLGCRGTVTGELVFDDVWVPDENFLGDELGKGVYYVGDILDEVRLMTGAMALGIAKGAYKEALEFSKKRIAFGQPIGNYQLIREKIADIDTSMNAARLMINYGAWLLENGMDCRVTAAEAKMYATEVCLKVVDELTRIYGANAFAYEYIPQRYFRDARFLLYGGGTHEVLKDFIGRMIIGKI
ncbi:MAG TPA: acyl-CoA dehydrogenase family protein [Syntrophorhabdaceae bacterium]|jgi:alkylation response protein AidB-like acyl-CoA dehydrogenase|nr:acyl-CoA dehydrogenase family protein [Syntrophorhabdaceae bacterium]HOF57643.1 acyl-CoA dehydrogenase family protein [Syntrophorhabdaceae bacterium]HOS04851.1 acyl-CoA dehydrogenase family protein [Syntrophorhabdaceae bacterium]HPH40853.1 acyl-CoA dehydrogenase family protein [Syntrophorhabdaceae bacterium]HPL40182.1 acyl-CoA dehydrogenase family protein [Syntrophorhabdaceae bacterium]